MLEVINTYKLLLHIRGIIVGSEFLNRDLEENSSLTYHFNFMKSA